MIANENKTSEDSEIKSFSFGKQIQVKVKATDFSQKINQNFSDALENKHEIKKEEPEVNIIKYPQLKNRVTPAVINQKNAQENIVNIKSHITAKEEQEESIQEESGANELETEEKATVVIFRDAVNKAFKETEESYCNDLHKIDTIALKQAMAKFIISPEIKALSIKSQQLIKQLPENNKIILKELESLSEKEMNDLINKLHEYSNVLKNNKLTPQKLKDVTLTVFRTIQMNYFVRFQSL